MATDTRGRAANPPGNAPDAAGGLPFNTLSWRWHLTTFVVLILAICGIVWGIYVPITRWISARALERGDAFRARAEALAVDTTTSEQSLAALDAQIKAIYPLRTKYTLWQSTMRGIYRYDPRVMSPEVMRHVKPLESMVAALGGQIDEADQVIRKALADAGITDTFAFLLERLELRRRNLHDRLQGVAGKPLDMQSYQDYDGICYTAVPDYLTILKQVRALFNREACFDAAMAEYITAIGYSRLWPETRLHMADLYRLRGWPEFALPEYCRVIKLDRAGAAGERAFTELEQYQGKHDEADYQLAVACLLRDDYPRARLLMRRFLDRAPGNVFGPKAAEVLAALEADNRIWLRQFLRDEVWI